MARNDGSTRRPRGENKYARRRWKRRKRRANEVRQKRKAKAKPEQFEVAPQDKGD